MSSPPWKLSQASLEYEQLRREYFITVETTGGCTNYQGLVDEAHERAKEALSRVPTEEKLKVKGLPEKPYCLTDDGSNGVMTAMYQNFKDHPARQECTIA